MGCCPAQPGRSLRAGRVAAPRATTPPRDSPGRAAGRTAPRTTRTPRETRSGSCRSRFQPAKLLVDELLELRLERLRLRVVAAGSPTAPAPGSDPDDDGAGEEPDDREHPGQKVESLRVRLRKHAAAVV